MSIWECRILNGRKFALSFHSSGSSGGVTTDLQPCLSRNMSIFMSDMLHPLLHRLIFLCYYSFIIFKIYSILFSLFHEHCSLQNSITHLLSLRCYSNMLRKRPQSKLILESVMLRSPHSQNSWQLECECHICFYGTHMCLIYDQWGSLHSITTCPMCSGLYPVKSDILELVDVSKFLFFKHYLV